MLGLGGNRGVSLPPLRQTPVTHVVATQYSRSSLLYVLPEFLLLRRA